jgi:hypothetical protein
MPDREEPDPVGQIDESLHGFPSVARSQINIDDDHFAVTAHAPAGRTNATRADETSLAGLLRNAGRVHILAPSDRHSDVLRSSSEPEVALGE